MDLIQSSRSGSFLNVKNGPNDAALIAIHAFRGGEWDRFRGSMKLFHFTLEEIDQYKL